MRILDRAVYVGPSLYAHFPVIRLEVDLGPLEEWPSAKLGPAFIDRLIEAQLILCRLKCIAQMVGDARKIVAQGDQTPIAADTRLARA